MKLKFYIPFFWILHCNTLFGQSFSNVEVSKEFIDRVHDLKGSYFGKKGSSLIFINSTDIFLNQYKITQFYEIDNTIVTESLERNFNLPVEESDWNEGFLDMNSLKDNYWFYDVGYMSDDYEVYFQNLWLQYKGQDYFLDSIYNADKLIHSSFSSDGRYLLVNTLNTLSDYYNPEQDNRIMVYDLSEIDQGNIKKEYIPCTHCSDSYLIGDQLFFTIGRKDGYDGFSNKDIYRAPWGSLKDSVKIASNTDILAISPDGKYILGTRFWDRQKTTAIMVDVAQKKYQMLLGRDYAKQRAFYSHYQNMFAFDFKGYLIYLDFPKRYPFDALRWRNEEIPDWTEEDFWQQFEHDPLPAN